MRTVVGVMGSGDPGDHELIAPARELGAAIARKGWVLLNGGRACGIMEASAEGARSEGGLVVGVLPDETDIAASEHLDIAIRTGMGHARNYINVLSSDVVIAMRGGAGTLSEIALALKSDRVVIALDFELGPAFAHYEGTGQLRHASGVAEAVDMAGAALAEVRR